MLPRCMKLSAILKVLNENEEEEEKKKRYQAIQ